MIEKWVTMLIEFQRRIGIIQDDDFNVYRYGYTLMIEVILCMTFSFVLGVLIGQMREVVFFLCIFIPLRSFCGGYHANKAWKCIVLSSFVIIGTVIISKVLACIEISIFMRSVCIIILALFVILSAPVGDDNKEIDPREKKALRGCSIITVTIELGVVALLIYKGMVIYYNIVLFSFVVQLVSMIFCRLNILR